MNSIEAKFVPYREARTSVLQNRMSGFEFKPHLDMRVAEASNEKGPIVTVCFIKVDDSFLITAMGFEPKSTPEEQAEAGSAVDLLLERQAQLTGVARLFIVTDQRGSECKELRTYESRITSPKSLAPITRVAFIN